MKRSLAVLVAALMLPVAPTKASCGDIERESLRGLKGVAVYVTVQCSDPWFTQQISEGTVKAKVELKLRTAGVRVYDDSDLAADKHGPVFNVRVLAIGAVHADQGDGFSSYAVSLIGNVDQRMLTVDERKQPVWAIGSTWERVSVLYHGRRTIGDGTIVRDIDDRVDEFLNDWLAAHGK